MGLLCPANDSVPLPASAMEPASVTGEVDDNFRGVDGSIQADREMIRTILREDIDENRIDRDTIMWILGKSGFLLHKKGKYVKKLYAPYFQQALDKTNRDNWKLVSYDFRFIQKEFSSSTEIYSKFFVSNIKKNPGKYKRKALIYGLINGTRYSGNPYSSKSYLSFMNIYENKLCKIIKPDEKKIFFSNGISMGESYYSSEEKTCNKYIIRLFEIAMNEENPEIIRIILDKFGKRGGLKTSQDYRRYIKLLKRARHCLKSPEVFKQKIRIACELLDSIYWKQRISKRFYSEISRMKNKEDDFFLCKNRNDKFIESHPQYRFCKGAHLYKKIRGGKYYSYSYLKHMRSEHMFNTKREIPGWNRFLEEYPDHPSTNDALYRLGRCYEIEGDYILAINCFLNAMKCSDKWGHIFGEDEGYIHYDSVHRIFYILDVEMEPADFERFISFYPYSVIIPEVKYSYAICLMRNGRYRDALWKFKNLKNNYSLKKYDLYLSRLLWGRDFTMETGLSRNLVDCTCLAGIQRKIDSASSQRQKARYLYQKGAYIYHRDMTFYNYLWNGSRAWYYYFSGGVRYSDEVPRDDPQRVRRENIEKRFYHKFYDRMQAISVFKQIPDVDPDFPDMDKVYFSIAMEYGNFDTCEDNARKFINWRYGRAKYFTKLLKEYPWSPLADDAVLEFPPAYWYQYKNESRENYVMRNYPFSDNGKRLIVRKSVEKRITRDIMDSGIGKVIDTGFITRVAIGMMRKR